MYIQCRKPKNRWKYIFRAPVFTLEVRKFQNYIGQGGEPEMRSVCPFCRNVAIVITVQNAVLQKDHIEVGYL